MGYESNPRSQPANFGEGAGNLPSQKLKNIQIENLTKDDFNSAVGVIYIDAPGALADAVTLNKAKEAVATFGANGILPNKGAITATTFTDAAAGSPIRPAVGEVWDIDNLLYGSIVNGSGSSNTITISLTDGTTTIAIHSLAAAGGTVTQLGNPATGAMKLRLTRQLWLTVKGSESDESICHIPYNQVAQ